MEEALRPMLCVDGSTVSEEAQDALRGRGISFDLWDGREIPSGDWRPPFLIFGRSVCVGLPEIAGFALRYEAIMRAGRLVREALEEGVAHAQAAR
jgi:hypothetical protein